MKRSKSVRQKREMIDLGNSQIEPEFEWFVFKIRSRMARKARLSGKVNAVHNETEVFG